MKNMMNKEKSILEMITRAYIYIIIILFPLIVDSTGFFHILECKWSFFVIVTITYILLCFIIFMFFLIVKRINYFKEIKFNKIHLVAVILLLVCIFSCIISPFRSDYNLIVGVGRGEGLLVTSLYILSFLFVSLFGKFDKKYILCFSISSVLFSLISILQFIGFNPLNMYQDGIGIHNVSFLGTIGNIDFVSAIVIEKEMLDDKLLPVGDVDNFATDIEIINGQIVLKGKSVFSGYLSNIVGGYYKEDGINCYKTGDLGYIRNGMLYCSGRVDNQIKYKGYRIELGDIENHINKIDGVNDSCVIAKKDDNGDVKTLKAFVDTNDSKLDSESIKNILKNTIPNYMIPKTIIFQKLTVNNNGKVDRKALMDL